MLYTDVKEIDNCIISARMAEINYYYTFYTFISIHTLQSDNSYFYLTLFFDKYFLLIYSMMNSCQNAVSLVADSSLAPAVMPSGPDAANVKKSIFPAFT